ncbi:sensor histidine kinase [Ideonella sp. YS5]|uniref:sensor histidine kinase n=1 Tax=Ideonella sp. YS5 TaxID=3453714 RepID=UPI003EE9DD2B
MIATGLRRVSAVRVLAPFAVVIAVLLVLCIGGYQLLSAVRAFVGGESLWSKSRSTAVAQLRVYADTASPAAFSRFEAALDVPLGDREAREALDAEHVDVQEARNGFLRGGNDAGDVDGMIWLYRLFSRSPLMQEAVIDWRAGDQLIGELRLEGHALRQRLQQSSPLPQAEAAQVHRRLDQLDAQLVAREKHFSESLGQASRATLLLLEVAVVALALLMGASVLSGAARRLKRNDELTRLALEKDAAERVARARMEFLSRLSHELRTPLNAVLGFSQLMLNDGEQALPAGAVERTRHIVAAGTHLLHLVEDVLDVTRIDAGQVRVQVQEVEPWPVLRAALNQVEPQREALGIAIEASLPSEPMKVRADAARLEQVFVNLLTNGCKYNRPGGRLEVAHRVEEGRLWIDFSDQGQGMEADEIETLFQPFKRLTRHWRIEGTGLGLVIVKLLMAQMGGTIAVASRPGQGSTFSVCLQRCMGRVPA